MIAKLIVARRRPRQPPSRACARRWPQCEIVGPKSNIEFLERLVRHPAVVDGTHRHRLPRSPPRRVHAGRRRRRRRRPAARRRRRAAARAGTRHARRRAPPPPIRIRRGPSPTAGAWATPASRDLALPASRRAPGAARARQRRRLPHRTATARTHDVSGARLADGAPERCASTAAAAASASHVDAQPRGRARRRRAACACEPRRRCIVTKRGRCGRRRQPRGRADAGPRRAWSRRSPATTCGPARRCW